MVKNNNIAIGKQVLTTTDYFLFKQIEGNREKNKLQLSKLKKSISDNYLFTILIVNENYEIIDGQHRFEIIKELGLPLNYVICEGYGLNEVHVLDQNQKTWTISDYMEGYANMGYSDYIQYREFKEKHGFHHQETMLLLGTHFNDARTVSNFKKGLFKIGSLKDAEALVKKILMIEPYYQGIRRRTFMKAIVTLLNCSLFNFDEFMHKLNVQPTAMKDCTTAESYIELIEQIYNYHRRDKVNLRFRAK